MKWFSKETAPQKTEPFFYVWIDQQTQKQKEHKEDLIGSDAVQRRALRLNINVACNSCRRGLETESMRYPIKAVVIALGGLAGVMSAAQAQPYADQNGGYYDRGNGPGYGYGDAPNYDQSQDPGYAGAYPAYDQPAYGPNDDDAYAAGGYGGGPNYAPSYDQSYGTGYAGAYRAYDQPAYGPNTDTYASGGYGYCDPYYGCPDDYYDLPVYDGAVFFDGGWFSGPFFWRDLGGNRQFWIHGGWHSGQFRGGHFGPALGRDYFAQHGIGAFAHSGNFGRQNFARLDPQRGFQRPAFNGFHGSLAGRSSFNPQPQRSFGGFQGRWGGHAGFQQQARAWHGGGNWHGGGFHGGRARHH